MPLWAAGTNCEGKRLLLELMSEKEPTTVTLTPGIGQTLPFVTVISSILTVEMSVVQIVVQIVVQT